MCGYSLPAYVCDIVQTAVITLCSAYQGGGLPCVYCVFCTTLVSKMHNKHVGVRYPCLYSGNASISPIIYRILPNKRAWLE